MTDTQGSVVQSYRYDEFGRLLQEASPTGPHSNYKYTAQEYDGSISELYNYRARYYDPEIGRFTQEDPALITTKWQCRECARTGTAVRPSSPLLDPQGHPQELNKYVYVDNNPVSWTDLAGLSRYALCDSLESPFYRWLCRRYVDTMCAMFGVLYCCDADLANCIGDLPDECDPSREKRFKLCLYNYALCKAGIPPVELDP